MTAKIYVSEYEQLGHFKNWMLFADVICSCGKAQPLGCYSSIGCMYCGELEKLPILIIDNKYPIVVENVQIKGQIEDQIISIETLAFLLDYHESGYIYAHVNNSIRIAFSSQEYGRCLIQFLLDKTINLIRIIYEVVDANGKCFTGSSKDFLKILEELKNKL